MNLIDHYGSYNNRKQQQNNNDLISSRIDDKDDKDNKIPLILISLKQRIFQSYPNDYTTIINCKSLDCSPSLGGQFMLQYLSKSIYLKKYQFYFEVIFNPALFLLNIRGTFVMNGLFIHLESKQRILMATRLLSNLYQQFIPLKFSINQISGEIYLQHSSFIDAAFTNLKYKRNLINLTSRLFFIIELIIKHRFILIFYLYNDFDVLSYSAMELSGFQKIIKARERVRKIEGNLNEICLKTYDQAYSVNLYHRKHIINSHIQYFTQHVEDALEVFTQSKPKMVSIDRLSNQTYPKNYINNFVAKPQQKFHFKINLKIQFLSTPEWKIEDKGGFGTIWSSLVKFKIVDKQFMKKFPPSNLSQIKQGYQQKFAMKTDTKVDRLISKISIQKQIISQIEDQYHPNILTFFQDQENMIKKECLYSLWEEHSSLKNYLIRIKNVSFYQILQMMEQAAKGLCFLHKKGIVHVDFKPANIIVGRKFLIKLTDFGQSHIITRKINRNQFGYTFPYAAPQIYQKGKIQLKNVKISQEIDLYSLGVTIYQCFFGEHIWQNQLKLYKESKCSSSVIPWIVPQKFRDAGQRRVAMIMAYVSLKCISRQPSSRAKLPWVITILQQCRLYLGQLQYR